MTAMIRDTELAELRRIVLETRTERRAGGVPIETRARAVAVMRADLKAGTRSVRELARELGVHEMTMYRWARDVAGKPSPKPTKTEAAFRQVYIVDEPTTIRAVHPSSGLVLDALDVRTMAALLRELGQ
jgi:transposase-like protein